MEDNLKIIPVAAEHLNAAADIAIAAWVPIRESFHQELGDELYNAFFHGWQQKKRREVQSQLMKDHGFVTISNGQVVGFISYAVDEEAKGGIIQNNAVAAGCQGLGIGSKQYLFVQENMRELGLQYCQVVTGLDEGHAPARRAYQKAGFERGLLSICYYKKL